VVLCRFGRNLALELGTLKFLYQADRPLGRQPRTELCTNGFRCRFAIVPAAPQRTPPRGENLHVRGKKRILVIGITS
jgi:hypothetical protein